MFDENKQNACDLSDRDYGQLIKFMSSEFNDFISGGGIVGFEPVCNLSNSVTFNLGDIL